MLYNFSYTSNELTEALDALPNKARIDGVGTIARTSKGVCLYIENFPRRTSEYPWNVGGHPTFQASSSELLEGVFPRMLTYLRNQLTKSAAESQLEYLALTTAMESGNRERNALAQEVDIFERAREKVTRSAMAASR